MEYYTGTYSPEDNKLRLYSVSKLEPDLYARVKAAGFIYAPKQELFVAPMWTPDRADLLVELCGEIGDEDTSLTERQEQRAERFEDYSEKRKEEAERAHEAVAAIADNIPLGQPILVGHHSEKHARRDADKITNGMRKAVQLWETSEYWIERARGAIRHAKYKERAGVRARRIKGLEADRRKHGRNKAEAEGLIRLWENKGEPLTYQRARAISGSCVVHCSRCYPLSEFPRNPPASQYEGAIGLWSALGDSPEEAIITPEQARDYAFSVGNYTIERSDRWIAHIDNRLLYERAMLEEQGGLAAERFVIAIGGQVLVGNEWLTVVRVNKANGKTVSVTTNAKYCRVKTLEVIKDYREPDEETVNKVKNATKLAPLCNYPGPEIREITKAEWKRRWTDGKYTQDVEATETTGRHRARFFYNMYGENADSPSSKPKRYQQIFITDEKRKDPPKFSGVPDIKPELPPREKIAPDAVAIYKPKEPKPEAEKFNQLRETLKTGVRVVAAPQLFPTPQAIAEQMIQLADIREGHKVLEPSAGTGVLADAIREAGADPVCCELNYELANVLSGKGYRVVAGDFIERFSLFDPIDEAGEVSEAMKDWDRIVMNPPFKNGIDIKHIQHAAKLLRPGGRLVALCANGTRQHLQLSPLAWHWEELPAGSFKAEGTNVSVVMLAIDAPELKRPEPKIEEKPEVQPETVAACGFEAFGMMPPCVLEPNHEGDHADGFGGFYGQLLADQELVQVPNSKELQYVHKTEPELFKSAETVTHKSNEILKPANGRLF